MIKHIVMFKFKDGAEKEVAKAKEMLEALPAKIDVIRKLEVGLDIVHSERAFDLVLIGEFDNMEDVNTYINHPEHVKVGDFMAPIRLKNHSVDFEF